MGTAMVSVRAGVRTRQVRYISRAASAAIMLESRAAEDIRHDPVAEAAAAVNQEHRAGSQVVEVRCHAVTCVRRHGTIAVYRLDVGLRVEIDWTWEGSSVWQGAGAVLAGENTAADDAAAVAAERAASWRGEVVGVDPVHGRLWVALEGAVVEPAVGPLWLAPFPFLLTLRQVYAGAWPDELRARLPARLGAALQPRASPSPPTAGVPPPFDQLWGQRWSCLWGPPGTGKTRLTGELVAERLVAGSGRMLVVSTTNKATDAVALAIGRALHGRGLDAGAAGVVRVGRAADYDVFKAAGLAGMLDGGDSAARMRVAELDGAVRRALDPRERAWLQALRRRALRDVDSRPGELALAADVRVLVTTVHAATSLLSDSAILERLLEERAPFATLVVDEAGLVARAVVAPLSLLAGERTLLVGDPRQLAPIAKMSRVLPPEVARWLAESGLGFLAAGDPADAAAKMLTVQHRMHPDVRAVVSRYRYDGRLADGPEVGRKEAPLSAQLHKVPRAVWYVLDEESDSLAATRAERGPGNRSWVRSLTPALLGKFFAALPELRQGPGLFVTPFVAQARTLRQFFVELDLPGWTASTVHAQQGVEADFVVFDTVHAGAHVWPTAEWQRLVNVALSRAREFVFLLASRDEMRAPFLAPLRSLLAPRCLVERAGTTPRWRTPAVERGFAPASDQAPAAAVADRAPESLGDQIRARQALRPLLSREQQRLCELTMDGKPRLVRGVAGSGKTIVLAHWLVQVVAMLRARPDSRVWVVYANRSLRGLIEDHVLEAWKRAAGDEAFPWQCVELHHARDLMRDLGRTWGLDVDVGFDYEGIAGRLVRDAGSRLQPLCDALFVDEAQDLGHATLHLLTLLVRGQGQVDAGKNVIVFYDNAQNVYRRGTPTWSELGLEMRGRSTVLKESFRSTRPIAEFALNVLHRLEHADLDPDHREIVRRGLIEESRRRGRRWFKVRFNQVEGPAPQVRVFVDLASELQAAAASLCRWIAKEGVTPGDVKVLYAGRDVATAAARSLQPVLAACGARVVVQAGEVFTRDRDTVVVTTPHSFKGYDAEIVLVLGADRFVGKDGPLGYPLYVALTRARSLLEVMAQTGGASAAGLGVVSVLRRCADDLACADEDAFACASHDDLEWVVSRLGETHRGWVLDLAERCALRFEPVLAPDGEVVVAPLFTYDRTGKLHVCLDPADDSPRLRHALEDFGAVVVTPP